MNDASTPSLPSPVPLSCHRWRVLLRPALALSLVVGLAACGTAGPGNGSCPAPAPEAAAVPQTSPTYVIGAGDQLGISVYHAPELSVPSLPVRPDGRISIPLVQDIMAAGKTPDQLRLELTERLRKYVQDPIVTVMVTGFVGPLDRQVKVIGEATEPAAIPYRDGMTVLDVMIATKGLTRYAAGNSSMIIRRHDGKQQVIKVRLSDLLRDGDYCDNVALMPGDTLIIPQSWF